MNTFQGTLFSLIKSSVRNTVQTKNYARWANRKFKRVYAAEKYEELEKRLAGEGAQLDTSVKSVTEQLKDQNETLSLKKKYDVSDIKWRKPGMLQAEEKEKKEILKYSLKPKKYIEPLSASKVKNRKPASTDMLQAVVGDDGNFIYTKMKDNDPRVGTILAEVKSKKDLNKKDKVLLEGKRLIKDALQAGSKLHYIIFSRKEDVEYLRPYLPKYGTELYKMPYREMQMWSDLTTTPGLMGIFSTPDVEKYEPKDAIPLTVVCDNIREPGNLGAILRTCAGVGCARIILTKGCVNLWEPKVLRSSAGSHFRLQIHRKKDWDEISQMIQNSPIHIADNRVIMCESQKGSNEESAETSLVDVLKDVPLVPYYSVKFSDYENTTIIIGGETEGVSDSAYKIAKENGGVRLNVPLSNDVESLNSATALGILAFEVKKQLVLRKK